MKIDVTSEIPDLSGEVFRVAIGSRQVEICAECAEKIDAAIKPLTVRLVCTRSLTGITEVSRKLQPDVRYARGQLAHKIYNSNEPQLDHKEELPMLIQAVEEHELNPLILFYVMNLLNPLGSPEPEMVVED